MVDLIELKKQIIKLADKTKIRSAKKMQGNDQVGALSYIIKNAVLQSDVRMYKREVFAYNGKHYEHIDGMMFAKMLIDIMEELAFGFGFIVAHRKKVIDFVIDNLIQKDITPERFIIPFNNCLLNTKTMEKLKHSPDHDILYCLKYDYDEKADCPLWMNFLSQVLPSEGLIEVLQECLGLLFVDRGGLKLEKMPILLGSGSNGKSVVFETIIGILGDNNISTYDMGSLTKGSTSEYNLAAIDGKILNYTSELDPKDFSGEIMKKLISGEPLMARQIYKEPILLKNIPLFICNANKLPETTDRTHGFFRRILPIPFEVTIKEKDQDKTLSSKLKNEYSGILNWIIKGRERILKNRVQFTNVPEINRIKEEYRIIQDSIYGFLRTNRMLSEGEEIDKYHISDADLYRYYCEYCREVTKMAVGKNVFINHIFGTGFKKYREGQVRGILFYCDRNPTQHWNVDVGNVYDDDEDMEVVMEEKDSPEWRQEQIPY